MAFMWTIWCLGYLSLSLAPLARSATESTTTTSLKATHETPAEDLGALLDAGEGAVVTLVAGDTRLAAHRAVLAARSPQFKAMLSNDTLDASSGQLDIRDVEGPVLRQLVAYLYTLQAPQTSSMAPQLLAAADRYGVSGLKAASEQQLIAQLAVENAASLAVLAVRHSCPRLKEAAVAFIRANFFSVVATQAWGRALVSHPEDMTDVMHLLTEPPAHTSAAAATDGGSTPGPQPHAGNSQTTVASEPVTVTSSTSPPGGGAVSSNSAPAAADGGSAPGQTRSGSLYASTPAPPACNAPLPDDHTVSRYRSLSAQEKGRRLIDAAKWSNVGAVRALLAAGADVEARDEDMNRWTALHWAATRGRADVASCLIDGGAEVDARESWKQATPLHCAAYAGSAAVVPLLAAASADVNARTVDGTTPLHLAAGKGHADVAAALLDCGAEVDARDDVQITPLILAAVWGRTAVVRLLAAASADLSARNKFGKTPLHYAAIHGRGEVAAALLEAGANRWVRDNDGNTPLDDAANGLIRQQLAES